jgi:hypothetical protein
VFCFLYQDLELIQNVFKFQFIYLKLG